MPTKQDPLGRLIRYFEFPRGGLTVWSTNQDRNLHPQERAQLIKQWKEMTWGYYRKFYGNTPQEPSIIQIKLPFATSRRRDPHNYCGTTLKAIIDGMVMAGAWADDTPEYVGHREPILYRGEMVVVQWVAMHADLEGVSLEHGENSHLQA